ncbi:MAG: ATP-binding protein [Methanomicrobiales archaeon HGW-Methanomicrobiales-3]|nr:MAG: ATP-binding protein [Methanomicrobiales archaeon HGW-Methanomicrobiales-3]
MSVDFQFWGSHQIWTRLSAEENRGRYYFWFNKEIFSNDWYEKRVNESIANVGPRYSDKYNVDLPISDIFNGFGRTEEFFRIIPPLFNNIQNAYKKLNLDIIEEITGESGQIIDPDICKLKEIHENIFKNQLDVINLNLINNLCVSLSKRISDWIRTISDKISSEEKEWALQNKNRDELYLHLQKFKDPYYALLKLDRELSMLGEFASGNVARSANVPILIVTGNAGNGKTHLFCDVALQRIEKKLPTILLLGGHFNDEEPWNQIIIQLGLNCSREEFLGALNTTAEIADSKCLIFIDALNEGAGKKLWRKYLAGMIKTLKEYPRLGMVLSIRSSYTKIIIPEGISSNDYIEIFHEGFSGYEAEATKIFFEHYKIERPTIPLLNPEFKNPLFLKTFCEAIHNHGETTIPKGIQGISKVFDYYIESIDQKLSREEYLDFDPRLKIVQKAMKKIALQMAKNGKPWLLYKYAKNIVDKILGDQRQSQSLFHHLISEGTLSEDIIWDRENHHDEIIRFPYERFSDYLITDSLFELYLKSGEISDLFNQGKPLYQLIKDESTCRQNQGLIEALSIQIPERYKKELSDIAPHCANFDSVREAFINSIIWRQPNAFSDSTLPYINNYIFKRRGRSNRDLVYPLLDAFLLVSSNPNHSFNADRLHKWLLNIKFADRDSFWTVYLYYRYNDETIISSLIDWAWFSEVKEDIDRDSRRLYGITLAWFLTSSHRFLRDRTTKALVSIFSNHIDILHNVIKDFKDVDDPYVLERLFAVAYGCAMRSNDKQNITLLAKDTFTWIFQAGCPPPNILLRDYARGVIECAIQKNGDLNIDIGKIRPPYSSEWDDTASNKSKLKRFEKRIKKSGKTLRATDEIYSSIVGFGDFARYIIGTNSDSFNWSSKRLKNSRLSVSDRYDIFVKSLDGDKLDAWKKFLTYYNAKKLPVETRKDGIITMTFGNKYSESTILKYAKLFFKCLNAQERKIYIKYIIPYLQNPRKYKKDDGKFDIKNAQLWILKRVFDLGWTEKRFGDFDNWMISLNDRKYMRSANKPERIGKKYQWIAYYEFLARVSDNFKIKKEHWNVEAPSKYEGTWQFYLRNIDPSCLLTKSKSPENISDKSQKYWWFAIDEYSNKKHDENDEKWLSCSTDLPDVRTLIEVVNPEDKSVWLNLNSIFNWYPFPFSDNGMHQKTKRELFYLIHGYIVKKSDIDRAYEWAQKQNFSGRWMPDPWEFHEILLGEFVWAPAYLSTTSNGYSEWSSGEHHSHKIPVSIHNPCIEYHWSHGEYDCSSEEGRSISMPSAWLINKMNLSWNGVEGKWYNNKGELIAFDPSVNTQGPHSLLVNKKIFRSFLTKNGYDIFWALLGEKNIFIGAPPASRLNITGSYRMVDDEVVGTKKSTYQVFEGGTKNRERKSIKT